MKKLAALALAALFVAVNAQAFIDKTEMDKEEVQRQLNELRVVKGMFISGRAWLFFNPVWGSGTAFSNMNKKYDFNPFMAVNMDMTAFPMPMIEIGTRVTIKRSQNRSTELNGVNLYGEFILYQFILLRIGQLSEKFTPFTLHSSVDQVWMRSELFNTYYQEDLYNNLVPTDGTVPMEGIKAKFDLALGEDTTVGMKLVGAKLLNDSTKGNSYDRYFGGVYGHGDLLKKAIGVEGAFVMYRDNTNSGSRDPNPGKSYMIYSGTASVDVVPLMNLPVFGSLGVQAELAGSRYIEDLSKTNAPAYGSALQGNFYATIKKMLNVKAGYRQIAYEFVSPGAQTRLVTPWVSGSAFQNDNLYSALNLMPTLFQNYFRPRIQFTRDNDDYLNFIYAMNTATPNRQGLFGDLSLAFKDWISASVSASKMQEARPIAKPNENPRNFLRVDAEASISLAKVSDLPALPKLSAFYVMENDDREDWAGTGSDESENLRIRILGAEAVVDLKTVKFIGVYQSFSVTGRKVIDVYDPNMQNSLKIAGYQIMDFGTIGVVDSIMGGGAIIKISQAVMMQIDGYWITHTVPNFLFDYNLIQTRVFINAKF